MAALGFSGLFPFRGLEWLGLLAVCGCASFLSLSCGLTWLVSSPWLFLGLCATLGVWCLMVFFSAAFCSARPWRFHGFPAGAFGC